MMSWALNREGMDYKKNPCRNHYGTGHADDVSGSVIIMERDRRASRLGDRGGNRTTSIIP